MPNLSTARRISSIRLNDAKTIGEITKENSDFLMEQTFDHDIQAKSVIYMIFTMMISQIKIRI